MTSASASFGHGWRAFAALLLAGLVTACNTLPAHPHCARTQSLESLNGEWTLEMAGINNIWTLELAPHPEHIGSWRGELVQGIQQRFAVVADLDDGELTMEESHDGLRIAATWLGTEAAGHCTERYTGERRSELGTTRSFVMRRMHPL